MELWIDSLQTEGKLPQAWELCFLNLKMCLFRPSDTGCEFQVLGRLRQEDGKSKPYPDFETPSQNLKKNIEMREKKLNENLGCTSVVGFLPKFVRV